MTLERLREILAAYGAAPTRWPDGERAAALRLVERSVRARALHEDAAELDLLLDAGASAEPPSRDLVAGVLAGAPRAERRTSARTVVPLRRKRWLTAALPLAAAAAVMIWIATSAKPQGRIVSAPLPVVATAPSVNEPPALPNEDLATVALIEYSSATDVLLSPYGIDVYDISPQVGCDDSLLGCPTMQDQRQTERSESQSAPSDGRPTV